MASLSGEVLYLAGFTLAHAVWSVSDTTPDELLCPLVVLETADNRRLLRFEAETQEQAIIAMKEAFADAVDAGEAVAAAREGAWRPNGPDAPSEDVVTVDLWAPGMDVPATSLQPFRRASIEGRFALLGQPLLVLGGAVVSPTDAAPAIEILLEGVASHSEVQPLWPSWQSG